MIETKAYEMMGMVIILNDTYYLYAICNEKGEWFRSKGRSGYGINWVSDFSSARIYNKIGSARAIISWYANHGGKQCNLVKLTVSATMIDETERVAKQKQVEERQKIKRQIKNLENQIKMGNATLEETVDKVLEAKRRLTELTKPVEVCQDCGKESGGHRMSCGQYTGHY